MKSGSSTSNDRPWQYAVAGGLLLGGPIARYLYYDRYPLLSAEAVMLIGSLATIGGAVLVFASRVRRPVPELAFAALVFLFLDLEFELSTLNPRDVFRHDLPGLPIAAAGALAFALIFRHRRAVITTLILGTFYLTALPSRNAETFTKRWAQPKPKPDTLRPIVHVVLDGQLGLGGFRALGQHQTADFLSDFYRRRGFDVYEGAYSRLYFTRNSIPAVLSLNEVDQPQVVQQKHWPIRIARNPYFARLARQGYRVNVYQSGFMTFCQTPRLRLRRCMQVQANGVSNIRYLGLSWTGRARRILEMFLNRSWEVGRRIWPQLARKEYGSSSAGRGLQLLRIAGNDVSTRGRRSDFYFLHLLLPHDPWELDDECNPHPRTLFRVGRRLPAADSLDDVGLEAYRQQVVCTHRALGAFLDTVDRVFGPNEAIVIVHGDHGVRHTPLEPLDDNLDQFRDVDYNASFSSLLAVRPRAGNGLVSRTAIPIQDFLWALIKANFGPIQPPDGDHFVYSTAMTNTALWKPHPLKPAQMLWAPETPKGEDPGSTGAEKRGVDQRGQW